MKRRIMIVHCSLSIGDCTTATTTRSRRSPRPTSRPACRCRSKWRRARMASSPSRYACSDRRRWRRSRRTITGTVTAVGDDVWTVGTTKVNITLKTTISTAPAPKVGDTVDVTGVKLPDGALIASTITRK